MMRNRINRAWLTLLSIVVLLAPHAGEAYGYDASITPGTVRSVKINNYNNWLMHASDPANESKMVDLLAQHDHICYTEAWDTHGLNVADLKLLNPSARVFRIFDLCVKNSWDSDWSIPENLTHMQTPLTKAEIDANDWWLRDGNGDIAKDTPNSWVLDVGAPGFKEAFLTNMLSRLNGKGFDGVVLDYWFFYLPSVWMNGAGMPPEYPTVNDWFTKAWKPFITYVTSGLHDAGYSIIGNCAGTFHSGNAYTDWQRTQVDGTIYEQWAFSWSGGWLPGDVVANQIYAFYNDPLESWTADFGLRSNDVDYQRKCAVALTMYYISIPPAQDNRSYHHYHDCRVYWLPLWDFYIGQPAAPAVKLKGYYFWHRNFTQGVVLLNYEPSVSITVYTGKRYRDVDGNIRTGIFKVPPRTGMILQLIS